MRHAFRSALLVLGVLALVAAPALAQAPTLVQLTTPATNIVMTPLSATAAVNTATTLTIPAPSGGLYNYVCSLAYQLSNDATGGAITNVVTTSTNFNSFALKTSSAGTVNTDSGVLTVFSATPVGGCAKSAAPGTATTFVSPASVTHATWTWYALYFQAP